MQIRALFVYSVRMSRRRRQRRRAEKTRQNAPPPTSRIAPHRTVRAASEVERLAYTRSQAAEALGVGRSTFDRRLLPLVETVELPWGRRLIPVDELERLLAELRRPARGRPTPNAPGRPRAVAPELVKRIRAEHTAGKSLAAIARALNANRTPTAHGGRQWWPSTVRAVLTRASSTAPA
jgi:DNA invertase Pin-like site-specific DNA recombinase